MKFFTLQMSSISWTCLLLKFETPMLFARPFSTIFSMAAQVIEGLTLSSYYEFEF